MILNPHGIRKILVQPNPRYPRHYRGCVRLVSTTTEGDFTFQGTGKLRKCWWLWSPLFWLRIAWAWIRPEKEEVIL